MANTLSIALNEINRLRLDGSHNEYQYLNFQAELSDEYKTYIIGFDSFDSMLDALRPEKLIKTLEEKLDDENYNHFKEVLETSSGYYEIDVHTFTADLSR